jgi:pilus assembly protein Flp/PilA
MFKKLQQKGQGLVEYALILVLVAIVIIIILAVLGPAIGNVFSQIIVNI